MSKHQRSIAKQLIAFALILTMIIPSIALADNEELAWFNLPEIAPFDYIPSNFQGEVNPPVSYFNNPDLEAPPPGSIEAIFRAQEAYWLEDSRLREIAELDTLVSRGIPFSGLTEDEHIFLYRHMDIAYGSIEITNELFAFMERNGHTLAESVELIRIISSGMFSYHEAQDILESIPYAPERMAELVALEQFVRKFDIADTVNPRRLVNAPFAPMHEDVGILPVAATASVGISDLMSAPSFDTRYSFIEARRMFLNNYSVSEIEEAFAIGAALQIEPITAQMFMEQQSYLLVSQRTTGAALELILSEPTETDEVDIVLVDVDELEDIIAYGLEIMNLGIYPMSAPMHDDIVSNPFSLNFNANESVALNTGSALFRATL